MHTYIHKVKYYKTDKMGITHHSNYVRWMEEARMDLLHSIGYGMRRLEKEGIISPVVSVECRYALVTLPQTRLCPSRRRGYYAHFLQGVSPIDSA